VGSPEEVPEEERLSLREAAKLLVPEASKRSLEALVARGNLRVVKEPPDPKTGRSSRVWTTREWLREYTRSPYARRRMTDEVPAPEQAHPTFTFLRHAGVPAAV
jgi:hypothetical protein